MKMSMGSDFRQATKQMQLLEHVHKHLNLQPVRLQLAQVDTYVHQALLLEIGPVAIENRRDFVTSWLADAARAHGPENSAHTCLHDLDHHVAPVLPCRVWMMADSPAHEAPINSDDKGKHAQSLACLPPPPAHPHAADGVVNVAGALQQQPPDQLTQRAPHKEKCSWGKDTTDTARYRSSTYYELEQLLVAVGSKL